MDERRYIVYSEFDEDTHRAVRDVASEKGVRISAVVEELVENALLRYSEMKKAGEQPASVLLRVAAIKIRERERSLHQLRQIAGNHAKYPTEESAEQLETLCDLVGVPIDVVLHGAQNSALVPLEPYGNGKGIGAAIQWLQDTIDKDKRVRATVVKAAAKNRGFPKHTLDEAKRRLGIVSKKDGKHWYWRWPAPE